MGVGIKVSRQGYNVNIASDKQLAFSSEWPLLPIEAEGNVTLTPAGGGGVVNEEIYSHGLDYTPVFAAERYSGGEFVFMSYFNCNDSALRWDGYLAEEINVKWKVFRRPIKTNYTAENLVTTDATEGDSNDMGILVTLPNYDIESSDKRNFSIRSDVRQLMVHMSGYTTVAAVSFTATHNLGYKPMFWAYIEDAVDSTKYYPITQQDYFTVTSTTTELTGTYNTAPGRKFAYIIFKDTINTDG